MRVLGPKEYLESLKYQKTNEEVFVNDVNWGDSLLGRLINSTIRKSKIGYNYSKVEPILKNLQLTMDDLIARSIEKDKKDEFLILAIREHLSKIYDVCTDTVDDAEKLKDLIGWDGNTPLWNTDVQTHGKWRETGTVKTGLLVVFFDYVDKDLDEKELKRISGSNSINKKLLLDQISIFIDNLRKISVPESVTIFGPQSAFTTNKINLVFSNTVSKDKVPTVYSESLDFNNNNTSLNTQSIFNYKLLNYDSFLESSSGIPPITGSVSNPIPTVAANKRSTVEEIFTNFHKAVEFDHITEKEIDLLTTKYKKIKFVCDVEKNYDQIIRICKIFRSAYDLYFYEVIPSGRTDGKVSQSVMREYIWAGSGNTNIDTKTNNAIGAWFNKKIFNKWREGVMNIIEDQKYRKALSNMKFILPGSEDKNENILSVSEFLKIFEFNDDDGKKPTDQSQGQILMEFIIDMLEPKEAADFYGKQSRLLRKYFGISKTDDIPTGSVNQKASSVKTVAKAEGDYLSWVTYTPKTYEGVKAGEGNIFAFPIKDDEYIVDGAKIRPRIIFFQLLEAPNKMTDKLIIRFRFDNMKLISHICEKGNLVVNDLSNWDLVGGKETQYYGIIDKKVNNNNLEIKFCTVNNKVLSTTVQNITLKIQSGNKKWENTSNKDVTISPNIYILKKTEKGDTKSKDFKYDNGDKTFIKEAIINLK